MTVKPSNVVLEKASFHGNKIFLNQTCEYEVPVGIQSKAGRILTAWFKKARLSLRVQGGSPNLPFVKADVALTKRRHGYFYNEDLLLLDLTPSDFKHEGGGRVCPLRDIILQDKLDLKSITLVMWRIRHGDHKLANVSNRFRKEYRPLMMHFLLNADRLEDS